MTRNRYTSTMFNKPVEVDRTRILRNAEHMAEKLENGQVSEKIAHEYFTTLIEAVDAQLGEEIKAIYQSVTVITQAIPVKVKLEL